MQTSRRFIVTGAFVVAAAVAAVPLFAQALTLKYNWPKDEALRYQFSAEINQSMSGLPGVGDMTNVITSSQTQQLTGDSTAADGVSTVKIKIESVKMGIASPMLSMNYDSADHAKGGDPMSAQLASVYEPLIGATLTATMAPNGVVRTLDGMAKIKAAAPQAQQAVAALGLTGGADPMSDEAMKSTYQNFASLPDKPVKAGDTWKAELTQPNPLGAQTLSSTFTFKGVEQFNGHEVVRIGVVETIKTAPGGAMGPFTVQVGDGTGTGDVLFNAKLGRLEQVTLDVTMPMTMNMSAPDGTAMSFQASTKTKTTIQLVAK